jgi:hypothetical protein
VRLRRPYTGGYNMKQIEKAHMRLTAKKDEPLSSVAQTIERAMEAFLRKENATAIGGHTLRRLEPAEVDEALHIESADMDIAVWQLTVDAERNV